MVKIIMVVLISTGVHRTPENKNPVKSSPSYLKNGEFTIKNPQAWILLVDDDGGDYDNPQGDTLYPDLQSYWTQALDVYYAGEYDVYEIKENSPGPDTSILKNYDVVIWYTGECWNSNYWSTLEAKDESTLGFYLDSLGGKLLLSSQDYFYDRYPNAGNFSSGQFPYNYLGLSKVVQDTFVKFGGIFEGDSNGIFQGISGYFSSKEVYSDTSDTVPCWLDYLFPIDTLAYNLWVHDSTDSVLIKAGVQKYDTINGYKIIYTNLGFETVSDFNKRAELLKRAVDWLTLGLEEKPLDFEKVKISFKDGYLVYSLPGNKKFILSVYDISGRKKLLFLLSGRGKTKINLKPGIYILKTKGFVKKLILIK